MIVQHLVVLQVVQQRRRHVAGIHRHKNGRARHAGRRIFLQLRHEFLERLAVALLHLRQQPAAAPPRHHQREHHDRYQQRQPAAFVDLEHVGREQQHVEHQQQAQRQEPHHPLHARAASRQHRERQHRSGQHRAGDGEAVGGGQVVGIAEQQHQDQHRAQQQRVDLRQVDLPLLDRRGMQDLHARPETQLHRLPGHRIRPGNHRLRRHDGRDRGQRHQGRQPHSGAIMKNGLRMASGSRSRSAPWPK